jgi:hypothetical protein
MEGIWYLAGSSAVRVRALGDSAARADFVSAVSMDIQPTVDGGAYAYGFTGIWRLEADSAVRVVEAESVTADTTSTSRRSSDSLGWLLYTKERRERARDDEEDADPREPPSDPEESP